MFADQFFKLVQEYKLVTSVGFHDPADKLNSMLTPIVFIICAAIIGTKSFFYNNFRCILAAAPSGLNTLDYLSNYCYTHGTIPMRVGVKYPQVTSHENEWEKLDRDERIGYYQWIVCIFALMAMIMYLPRVFWRGFCYNRMGHDYESIVESANSAIHANDKKSQDGKLQDAANIFYTMLHYGKHRLNQKKNFASNHGIIKKIKRWIELTFIRHKLHRALSYGYLIFKIISLTLAILELYLLAALLGDQNNFLTFGFQLARNLATGNTWENSTLFPRTSFCYVKFRAMGGRHNRFVAQCVLPINMFNERITLFLWFYITAVIGVNIWFFFLWVKRLNYTTGSCQFVGKYLHLLLDGEMEKHQVEDYSMAMDTSCMNMFTEKFLKKDGIFVLRMLATNVGDLTTGNILLLVYKRYLKEQIVGNDHTDEAESSMAKSGVNYLFDTGPHRNAIAKTGF